MKEQLLTRMIHLYGFEHPAVIQFARFMETASVEILQTIVKVHEEVGLTLDWEE